MSARYTTALALLLLPFFSSAQEQPGHGHLGPLHGQTLSAEVGLLARLKAHELPIAPPTSNGFRDPATEMARRAGVDAHGDQRSVDYDFFGVSGYGGYVVPMATVNDGEGNIYVTGAATADGPDHPGAHQMLVKIDAAGDTVWKVLEPVTTYAAEAGLAIILDQAGQPVVAGSFWNGSDMDYRVTKYDVDGTLLWQHITGGTGNGVDMPTAMTMDADGNILVTGLSWSGTSVDYMTVKYDANGAQLWVMRDNGVGGDTWNEPAAITTDAAGNVYVTGFSENEQYWAGYYTLKYSPDGDALWQQRYTYTGPPTVNNSYARAIAVDDEGNVYVTGTIDRGNSRFGTIKYDTDGDQQWMKTFRSGLEMTDAYSIALGPDDLVYVGGEHNGEYADDGFVLVGYSTAGDSLWSAQTDDLIDVSAPYLQLDNAGNAVIGGIGTLLVDPDNFITVGAAQARKYAPSGDPLDVVTYAAPQADTMGFLSLAGMEVDASGGIAFTVQVFYTCQGSVLQTAQFPQGSTDPAWTAKYHDVQGSRARMLSGFVDHAGNSFCTGDFLTFTSGFNTTRFLVKHSPDGGIAWERHYDTAVDGPAAGILGAVDNAGDARVYLIPENDFSGDPLTLRLKKLDADGNELWEAQKELQQPSLYSITVDDQGNTFLSGSAISDNGVDPAFVVVKFDTDGNELWTSYSTVDGANSYTGGNALPTSDGGLLLAGSAGVGGWFSNDLDFIVTKFNADGTVAWATSVPVDNASGAAVDVATNVEGNVFATGYVTDQSTYYDNDLTAEFSPDGALMWSALHGEADHNERTYAVKTLSSGDAVVVGYKLAISGEIHNELIRYDQEGNEIWTTLSGDQHFYRDLHVDENDNSYILDQVYGTTFPYRLFNGLVYTTASVLEIGPDGDLLTEEQHTGPELSEFYPELLFAHDDGRLVFAGTLTNESYFEGIYLFDADLELTTSIAPIGDAGTGTSVGQAWPNPFRDHTSIPVTLERRAPVRIQLFDDQGRMVRSIMDRELGAGQHMVPVSSEGLAPGHYVYHVVTPQGGHVGKLVVVE
jgi:hypothetical protein